MDSAGPPNRLPPIRAVAVASETQSNNPKEDWLFGENESCRGIGPVLGPLPARRGRDGHSPSWAGVLGSPEGCLA